MVCKICGAQVSDEYNICPVCGSYLPSNDIQNTESNTGNSADNNSGGDSVADSTQIVYCVSCGNKMMRNYRFCNACGAENLAYGNGVRSASNSNQPSNNNPNSFTVNQPGSYNPNGFAGNHQVNNNLNGYMQNYQNNYGRNTQNNYNSNDYNPNNYNQNNYSPNYQGPQTIPVNGYPIGAPGGAASNVDNKPGKSKKKGLIIAGLAGIVALIIGTVLFFVLKDKDKGNLIVADKKIDTAIENELKYQEYFRLGAYDEFTKYIDSIPKGLYDKIVKAMANAENNSIGDYLSFEDARIELKNEVEENGDHRGDYEKYYDVEYKAAQNAKISIRNEYTSDEFLNSGFYDDLSESDYKRAKNLLNELDKQFDVKIVEGTVTRHYEYSSISSSWEDEDDTHEFSVVLVKYNGKWTPINIMASVIYTIDSKAKADDITASRTLLTAMQTAMADEDCYSEVASMRPDRNGKEVTVLTVTSPDTISATPYLKSEIASSIGSSGLPIKYRKEGAASYSVTIDGNDTLSVYIGTESDPTKWQIYPSTDSVYR